MNDSPFNSISSDDLFASDEGTLSRKRLVAKSWFLTGETASGKSAVAIELAERLNAEILSMDSMAVYQHLNIGTAKPSETDQQKVPHHLIDLVPPDQNYSVSDYLIAAIQKGEELLQRGKTPLFVGGSPLYLKTMLRGFFGGPDADWKLREELESREQTEGEGTLHRELSEIDPDSAKKLHIKDLRRIVRAIEVFRLTGQPLSSWHAHFNKPYPKEECRVFWLSRNRDELRERIALRVDQMFERGLLEEVKNLQDQGIEISRTAKQALGYREVLQYLEGKWTLEECRERTIIHTHQFAKRQRTWFRGLSEVHCLPVTAEDSREEVAERILRTGQKEKE
ncbi:tRNA dimethylallyltransferase [Planctomycetales bacterium 10988]|nr:tRNA dimethylallyltransferase [Planctomycetales bacterium 10988]